MRPHHVHQLQSRALVPRAEQLAAVGANPGQPSERFEELRVHLATLECLLLIRGELEAFQKAAHDRLLYLKPLLVVDQTL